MKIRTVLFFGVLVFCSFSVLHDYYVSTTTIRWVPEKEQFQLTSRFFLDDVESLMQQTEKEKMVFSPDNYPDKIDAFVQDFYLKNIEFKLDGEEQFVQYLGREYQDELLVVYAEVSVKNLLFKRVDLGSTFLISFLKGQQNIHHLILPDQRKSFLLTKNKTSFSYQVD